MHAAHFVRDCKTPIKPVSVSPQWFSGKASERDAEREREESLGGLEGDDLGTGR